jgi:hypothetical protein
MSLGSWIFELVESLGFYRRSTLSDFKFAQPVSRLMKSTYCEELPILLAIQATAVSALKTASSKRWSIDYKNFEHPGSHPAS